MFRVALAQMNSIDDIPTNISTVLKLVDEACSHEKKPELILFPENTLFFRMSTADTLEAIDVNSSAWAPIKEKAKQHRIHIHLTTALRDGDNQVYNGSVLIRPTGELEVVYRKIHLFDISLTGQKPIRESDAFKSGSVPNTFEINGIKFGSSVCYDIRFSELYSQYAKAEVDVILIPAAFLVKTGQAHWEILLRARAIESQCYVLAPAQVGVHKSCKGQGERETYGHTMAVGPWGQIIETKMEQVGLIFVEINKEDIHHVRAQIPMKSHRRL